MSHLAGGGLPVRASVSLGLAVLLLASGAPPASMQTLCTSITITRSPTRTEAGVVSLDRNGGSGLVYINASEPGCRWQADPAPAWVTFPDGNSGTGSGWLKIAAPATTTARQASIQVGTSNPQQPASFLVTQSHDTPHGNGTVQSPVGWTASPSTATVAQPFKVTGFAIDTRATTGTGVSSVELYWVDNTGLHLIGTAAYGLPHQHIADALGSEFLNSGWEMIVTGIPTGGTLPAGAGVSIQAFARSAVDASTLAAGATRVTVVDPDLIVAPRPIQFGAAIAASGAVTAVTPAQTIDISGFGWQSPWTATKSEPWITIAPTSGTGPGSLSVTVDPALVTSGPVGLVRVSVTGTSFMEDIAVALTQYFGSSTAPPYGVFDAPPSPASGAVPLTGWALDDVGVARVSIYRDRVASEGGTGLVYVGEGTFTEGARPDVAAAFPNAPQKTRAGWGYMLLSNVLPGSGDGTFTFHAFAVDGEGRQTLLGSRDVTLTNATADLPFGALDAPGPGAIVSGVYTVTGWVVAPSPMQINLVNIVLDGQTIGVARYGLPRPDVAGIFSGPNAPPDAAASGFRFTIDTRGLANGLHTIAFVARSNASIFSGLGSRFFTVNNP